MIGLNRASCRAIAQMADSTRLCAVQVYPRRRPDAAARQAELAMRGCATIAECADRDGLARGANLRSYPQKVAGFAQDPELVLGYWPLVIRPFGEDPELVLGYWSLVIRPFSERMTNDQGPITNDQF